MLSLTYQFIVRIKCVLCAVHCPPVSLKVTFQIGLILDSQEKAGTVAQPLLPMNEHLNRPTGQFHRTSLDHSDSKEMILVSGGQLASISTHLQNSLVQLLVNYFLNLNIIAV